MDVWSDIDMEKDTIQLKTRPSKLCQTQHIHHWKMFTPINIHPWKFVTPEKYYLWKYSSWKIFIPENIHPWKIFTTEKYSLLKNIHSWKYSPLAMHKIVSWPLSLSSQEDSQYNILNPWTPGPAFDKYSIHWVLEALCICLCLCMCVFVFL